MKRCLKQQFLLQTIAQGLDFVFAHGQLYVAYSRVVFRHGLRVAARVTADDNPIEEGLENIVLSEVL